MADPTYERLQDELVEALLAVDRLRAKDLLMREAHETNFYENVERLVVPALERIGLGWENGQYSLSQIYMSGKICEEIVDLVLPPEHELRRTQPKTAIVVLEDYHFLGKRIVYSVLRASGFELLNYGRMNSDQLVQRITEDGIEILLISVLMLPAALQIKELRRRLQERGSPVKIVVGGAPFRFDPHLWQEVGADACGDTAAEAVEIINRLVEEMP